MYFYPVLKSALKELNPSECVGNGNDSTIWLRDFVIFPLVRQLCDMKEGRRNFTSQR